jgi:hypothetical protein
MSNMQDWMRWEPTRDRRRFGFLVLTPARATVGVGALVTMIAGFMPWAEGTVPGTGGFEPIFFSGLGGAGDGIVLVVLAGLTAFFVLHETPATSRIRLVHVIPYVLVILAAMTVLTGFRAAQLEIAAWERRGGTGSISLGLYVAIGGVALMVAGMLALLPTIVRWRRASTDPADLMTVSRRGIVESLAGLVGILVGGALGIELAISLTPIPVIGLIALGAIFGALLGAYAGSWLVRVAADEIAGRRSRTG